MLFNVTTDKRLGRISAPHAEDQHPAPMLRPTVPMLGDGTPVSTGSGGSSFAAVSTAGTSPLHGPPLAATCDMLPEGWMLAPVTAGCPASESGAAAGCSATAPAGRTVAACCSCPAASTAARAGSAREVCPGGAANAFAAASPDAVASARATSAEAAAMSPAAPPSLSDGSGMVTSGSGGRGGERGISRSSIDPTCCGCACGGCCAPALGRAAKFSASGAAVDGAAPVCEAAAIAPHV